MSVEGERKAFKASEVAKEGYSVLRKHLYGELHDHARAGEPIAWCAPTIMYGAYAMILTAMDIAYTSMDHFGAVCAVKGVAPKFMDICARDYVSDSLCSYMRNMYGFALLSKEMGQIPPEAPLGGWPQPTLMVSRGASYCDGTVKVFQALARYCDVPVYNCDLGWATYHKDSNNYLERLIKYQYGELKDFVEFAQRVTGKKMDWDKLSAMVYRNEEILRVWREVNNLRKNRPCPISNLDFWAIIAPGFWLPGREETLKYFQDLHAEVKTRVENKMGVVPEEKFRLMWIELPPWHSLEMFEYFMQHGAVFVIESETYSTFLIPVEKPDHVTDPLMRLAYEVSSYSVRAMERAQSESLSWRTQRYLDMARDWKVDGVVSHPLLSCRTSAYSLRHAEDVLQKKDKLPVIRIQGDLVDKRAMPPFEQLKPQIDAFLQTVAYQQENRKKAGLFMA
jgi:benzoyl-CoA reductase/2-hydroxyglutaryl-CoA dehydratase subunit BcrC/BadD/HgdB